MLLSMAGAEGQAVAPLSRTATSIGLMRHSSNALEKWRPPMPSRLTEVEANALAQMLENGETFVSSSAFWLSKESRERYSDSIENEEAIP